MLPVSDVIPSRAIPVVTITLLALNSLAFLSEILLDRPDLQALVRSLGLTPATFSWPALFTNSFLHAGWLHVSTNMLWLWLFGDNVEDALGRFGFLSFYLVCGAVAALAQTAAHPSSGVPLIGASGAIAGVMGAYLVLYPRSRVLTAIFAIVYFDLIEVPAIFFLGIWLLLQLFSGVGSIGAHAADGALAFWAHAAGFLTGVFWGTYARLEGGSLRRYWR